MPRPGPLLRTLLTASVIVGAAVAVLGAAVVVVSVVAVWLARDHGAQEPAREEMAPVATGDGADAMAVTTSGGDAGATPPDEPPPREAHAPDDTVRITLIDLPAGATVLVDDRPVDGPAFEVERSDRPMQVVVRADGYRSWSQHVAADEPTTITVRMQRRDREERDVAAPSPQQSPPESPIPPADSPVSSFGEMP